MTEARLYYTAPSDAAFSEMKSVCMDVWAQYDNRYGYVDEKQDRIKNIPNVHDNFMYMFSMFDQENQREAVSKLSPQTKDALRERMIDGGNNRLDMQLIGL